MALNVGAIRLYDVVKRLGSVEEMITDTPESLQLTQGLKHEPSVPVINTEAHQQRTHLNMKVGMVGV